MENIKFYPLTSDRWKDIELLFGERGACGGCWCMTWRLTSKEFSLHKGSGNKKLLRQIVDNDSQPGILAYDGSTPVGWCAVAPRYVYKRLEKSKVLKPIDEKEVWSVTCFFILKGYRRRGLSTLLLKEAIKFCKSKGAEIIEGYPSEPYGENIPPAFAWTGIPSAFIKAGFTEAGRRSKSRPIMRYYIK